MVRFGGALTFSHAQGSDIMVLEGRSCTLSGRSDRNCSATCQDDDDDDDGDGGGGDGDGDGDGDNDDSDSHLALHSLQCRTRY